MQQAGPSSVVAQTQPASPVVQAGTSQPSKQPPPMPNFDPGVYALVQTVLWVAMITFGILLFRRQIGTLFGAAFSRIRSGGSVAIASFKLDALPQVQQGTSTATKVRGLVEIRDDDGAFHDSRSQFRAEFRNLFLVHRIAPSTDPEQLYDIVIYLVPSLSYGSLSGVVAVEYYMGKYWGRQVFRSIDRATGFLIATAAYAPFTCTARVCFSDGATVYLHRYVDFEMGQLPPGAFRQADA